MWSGTNGTRKLHVWPEDRNQICDQISNEFGLLKVLLKTRNEKLLLPIWIEHYLQFLKPHEIIIADNMSTDTEVLALYQKLDPRINVFQYASLQNPYGAHNVIHSREIFGGLYNAIRKSSKHLLIADTDELLIHADSRGWSVTRNDFEKLLKEQEGKAVATVWLDPVAGSRELCDLSAGEVRLVEALAWGKPLVPASLNWSGQGIHNGQSPIEMFGIPSGNSLVLLHLMRFNAEQRLKSNRQKLEARGIVTLDTPFDEIARIDASNFKDWTVARLVRETKELLAEIDASAEDVLPQEWVRFSPEGRYTYSSDVARDRFEALFYSLHDLQTKAFDLAHNALALATAKAAAIEHGKDGDPDSNPNQDQMNESFFRNGMETAPYRLDAYGDPFFRKNLIRLLVSEGRWDEARSLIPHEQDIGLPGWHHILFARAYDRIGRHDEAEHHWREFIVNRPHHPEALTRLSLLSQQTASRPATDGDA